MAMPTRPLRSAPVARAWAQLSVMPVKTGTPGGRPDAFGDGGQHRTHDAPDGDERRQATGVDAGHGHQLRVVGGHTQRPVVDQLAGEHRPLGGGQGAGEAGRHVIDRLEVGRGGLMDRRLIVLERQEVTQRQTPADGRNRVALDPGEERLFVTAQDLEAVGRPALIEVEPHRGNGRTRRVDGHDRRVLATEADRRDHRPWPPIPPSRPVRRGHRAPPPRARRRPARRRRRGAPTPAVGGPRRGVGAVVANQDDLHVGGPDVDAQCVQRPPRSVRATTGRGRRGKPR